MGYSKRLNGRKAVTLTVRGELQLVAERRRRAALSIKNPVDALLRFSATDEQRRTGGLLRSI